VPPKGASRRIRTVTVTPIVIPEADGLPGWVRGRLSGAARWRAAHGEEWGVAESGDVERAFREFVTARSPALLRTAYLLVGDWASAEDLVQVALTKTYLAWRRLNHIDAVEAYVRRVLVNTASSWWRRRWHRERPSALLPERAVPDGTGRYADRDALLRHLRALPVRQRAVLVLRYYEDMSEAETARVLGVSVGTVKSQSSRGIAALRARMSAGGAGGPEAATGPGAAARRSRPAGTAPRPRTASADHTTMAGRASEEGMEGA
jgi:RNA polymerase sigma-70 factor (ECF subfamily)